MIYLLILYYLLCVGYMTGEAQMSSTLGTISVWFRLPVVYIFSPILAPILFGVHLRTKKG